MVSNPNDVPPAFRGRPKKGPSYTGMTDDQVLKVAANAFQMAQMLPIGSGPRVSQWSDFDSAILELGRRTISHVLEKLHEHERELPAQDTALPPGREPDGEDTR
jgi:hypothetical protein